jgi:hypothetical protein
MVFSQYQLESRPPALFSLPGFFPLIVRVRIYKTNHKPVTMFLGTPNRKPFRAGRAITAAGYIKYQNLKASSRERREYNQYLLRGIVMILMPLDHCAIFFKICISL